MPPLGYRERKRITFHSSGAYWSIAADKFAELQRLVDRREHVDLIEFGARRLVQKPTILDYPTLRQSSRKAQS